MPIYEFGETAISRLDETTFASVGLHERRDLQRLLREHVEVIAPETLVISEEFGDWEDSQRRIDLLAIDKAANLVVIELKRTEDGGHMELQAIRYAAMISTMTFDQAVDAFGRYLMQPEKTDQDPRTTILEFLAWEEPDDDKFAQDVRIVLASADFSKELASSVLWLIDHGFDIRCVRMEPYSLDDRTLVNVQQIIPLPEVADYQIQVRDKAQKKRQARASNANSTRFDVQIGEEVHPSMPKRRAILLICKHLCEKGVDPDEMSALFDWLPNRGWHSVDGLVDAVGFLKLAYDNASSRGSKFRRIRWFCEDDELVQANGKSYALSNQWGGKPWHKAMGLLKEKYSRFGIDFSPTP